MGVEKHPKQVLLQSFLGEETRKDRRNLLVISAISIAIVQTGLIPTKISALGIDFSPPQRTMLLRLLSGVVAYFLIGFIIYALSELESAKINFRSSAANLLIAEDVVRQMVDRGEDWLDRPTSWLYALRYFFDFVLPQLLAGEAIAELWAMQSLLGGIIARGVWWSLYWLVFWIFIRRKTKA